MRVDRLLQLVIGQRQHVVCHVLHAAFWQTPIRLEHGTRVNHDVFLCLLHFPSIQVREWSCSICLASQRQDCGTAIRNPTPVFDIVVLSFSLMAASPTLSRHGLPSLLPVKGHEDSKAALSLCSCLHHGFCPQPGRSNICKRNRRGPQMVRSGVAR